MRRDRSGRGPSETEDEQLSEQFNGEQLLDLSLRATTSGMIHIQKK